MTTPGGRTAAAAQRRPPMRSAIVVAAASAALLLAAPAAIQVMLVPDAEAGDSPCRVWIRGQQLNIVRDGDGNLRSNPDGTLYPGDAFYYAFYYGFSGLCVGQYVAQPVTAYRDILAQPSGHSAGTGYVSTGATSSCFGATGGTDELGAFGRTGTCGGISKTVYGFELHCKGSGKDRKCRIIVRPATAAVVPTVKAPVVEADLREHTLTDAQGYPAANRDMTNYVWDPIAIEHEAVFSHRDEREGTITFEYDRDFGPLHELGGCERDDRGTCRLEHDPPNPASKGLEFRPHAMRVHNGGGLYAYAAQDDSAIGQHAISYRVKVLNEGRQINSHSNSTEQLVVSYEPKYDHHPYPVLADVRQYAYDDRHGIAMLYHGSYGGGASDVPEIHPDRRSKIGGFNATTRVASSVGAIGVRALDASLMEWDSAAHVDGADEEPYMSLGEHAMFTGRGYGVLRLAQEASPHVVDERGTNRWVDLVWTENTVHAGEFAGGHNRSNYNYSYAYPPGPMAGAFGMTAYGSGGGIDADAGMSLTATPLVLFGGMPPWNSTVPGDHGGVDAHDRVTFWLDDYIRAKTMRETGDPVLVEAVLADTHGRHAAADASYGGVLEAWLPKTALEYRPGPLAETLAGTGGRFTELGGGTVEEIELPDDETDYDHPFLALPRHLALAAVPYTEYHMTAASHGSGTTISRNRTIEAYPDYLAVHEEIVNIEAGNAMDARRFEAGGGGTTPTVFVSVDPAAFGEIVRMEIDGVPGRAGEGACQSTCTLVHAGAGTVRAYNVWGGSASAWVNGSHAEWFKDPSPGLESSADTFLLAGGIAIVGYLVYRAVRAVARAHEEPVE